MTTATCRRCARPFRYTPRRPQPRRCCPECAAIRPVAAVVHAELAIDPMRVLLSGAADRMAIRSAVRRFDAALVAEFGGV